MRISDWSSDVCSSDLFGEQLRIAYSRREAGQDYHRIAETLELWIALEDDGEGDETGDSKRRKNSRCHFFFFIGRMAVIFNLDWVLVILPARTSSSVNFAKTIDRKSVG